MPKNLKKFYWVGFGMALSLVLSGLLLAASPEKVKVWAAGAPAGDTLSHETLSSLGKFKKGGSATLPDNFAAQFGTNKIQWSAGERPVDALPAGVWNSAFKVGQLSTAEINPSQDMDGAGLDNYGFVKGMPMGNLIKGIPPLGERNISDVKPIADLVAAKVADGSMAPPAIGDDSSSIPITKIDDLVKSPGWAETPMPSDLSPYAASDLPGLANAPIGNFPGAMGKPASKFPGLANMPIADMPGFNLPSGYQVGYFDAIRTKEPAVRKVISGSKETPNAICESKDCNHIEVQAIFGGVLSGAQIVDGSTQTVNGGYGFLRSISSQEKAGMQPYGEPIQEVYENLNAKAGDVDRNWYFNLCNHGWIDWGCSAHFIGPIPIGTIHEGDKLPLLLGNISIPVKLSPIKPSAVRKLLSSANAGNTSSTSKNPTPTPLGPPPTVPKASESFDVKSATNKITAVLPVTPEQTATALENQKKKINPSTGQAYPDNVVLRRTIEELVSGTNSPDRNNATSLELGQTVDEIVKQLQ